MQDLADNRLAGHWRERVAKERNSIATVTGLPYATLTDLKKTINSRNLLPHTDAAYCTKARSSFAWNDYKDGHNPIAGYCVRWPITGDPPFSRHRTESVATAQFPAEPRFERAKVAALAQQEHFAAVFADPAASRTGTPEPPPFESSERVSGLPPPPPTHILDNSERRPFTKYLDAHVRRSHLLPKPAQTWGP